MGEKLKAVPPIKPDPAEEIYQFLEKWQAQHPNYDLILVNKFEHSRGRALGLMKLGPASDLEALGMLALASKHMTDRLGYE